MAPFAKDIGDDADLDELMTRVREAALGTGAGGSAMAVVQPPADAAGDPEFVKVMEAQIQLNGQLRKTLAELVECLRTLRDDWGEAQKELRHETGRRLARKPSARRKPLARARRDRRTNASRRSERVHHATKGGRQRS